MRVITLHPEDVRQAVAELCADVQRTWAVPDAVVCILNGGRAVAAAGLDAFARQPALIDVHASRPGTQHRRRMTGLLRYVPYRVLDRIRIVESYLLSCDGGAGSRACNAEAIANQWASAQRRILAGAQRILIVDDAVDSGSTMKAAMDAVRRVCAADADVRCLALVQTTVSPAVTPDYCVYRGGVLLRFPWSSDYKS